MRPIEFMRIDEIDWVSSVITLEWEALRPAGSVSHPNTMRKSLLSALVLVLFSIAALASMEESPETD